MGGYRPFHSLYDETINASGTITANRFVTPADAQATVQGEQVLGVARTDGATGDDVAVTALGVASVEAGAAITKGDPIITDAQGRAISQTVDTEYKAGSALNDVSAAGGFVQVLFGR